MPKGRLAPLLTKIQQDWRPIMGFVKRRYSKEEFARRGDAIYEKDILPKLTAKDAGKFLAIDIETGEHEIAADEMKAGDKLRARVPDAQIWMVRVGYAAPRSFGGRQVRQEMP
jgi:hypothetical protein